MRFKQLTSLILAGLIFLSPGPIMAATGCSYPTSLDSFADKVANDFLTVADVNKTHCAIEKLETLIGTSPIDGGIALGSGTSPFTYMAVLAKGSLVVGDGATDPIPLVVGANDTVLTADSGEASGLKWVPGTPVYDTVRKTTQFTTTSTSFVDVTDLVITITTGANRVLLLVSGTIRNTNTARITQAGFEIDNSGTTVGENSADGDKRVPLGGHYLTDVLTAASHTFKVQIKTNNADGTAEIGQTDEIIFSVIEILGG